MTQDITNEEEPPIVCGQQGDAPPEEGTIIGGARKGFTVIESSALPFFRHPVHAIIRDKMTGQTYRWNARQHRKLRSPLLLSSQDTEGKPVCCCWNLHLVSFEPHIVTWWNAWIGFVANTLWVINGVYATWPEVNVANGFLLSYITAVIGAFLFIVTGYLGIVEVINHNSTDIVIHGTANDIDNRNKRVFTRTESVYGQPKSPLKHDNHGLDRAVIRNQIRKGGGYPIVFGHDKERTLITRDNMEEVLTVGEPMDILIGDKVLQVTISSLHPIEDEEHVKILPVIAPNSSSKYQWWTKHPDLSHVNVFGAYLFFVCTIIFFIPACLFYPLETRVVPPPVGMIVFFVDCLQIIPSIGFIIVGHIGMAEASGRWLFHLNSDMSIGYWVAIFNIIGGWGFLLSPIFAIPGSIDGDCCPAVAKWGAGMSTFCGSCSFWVAGVLAIIEFSNKQPVRAHEKQG